MTLPDLAVLLTLAVCAGLLVGANVALQRLVRPEGGKRIAGCCGMALPAEIVGRQEELR